MIPNGCGHLNDLWELQSKDLDYFLSFVTAQYLELENFRHSSAAIVSTVCEEKKAILTDWNQWIEIPFTSFIIVCKWFRRKNLNYVFDASSITFTLVERLYQITQNSSCKISLLMLALKLSSLKTGIFRLLKLHENINTVNVEIIFWNPFNWQVPLSTGI